MFTKQVEVQNPQFSNIKVVDTIVNHHRISTRASTLGIKHGEVKTSLEPTACAITGAAFATGGLCATQAPGVWSSVKTLGLFVKSLVMKKEDNA